MHFAELLFAPAVLEDFLVPESKSYNQYFFGGSTVDVIGSQL